MPNIFGTWHSLIFVNVHALSMRGSGMEKRELKPLIQQGLSLRQIAERLESPPSTIRYWLRKYQLRLKQQPFGSGYVQQLTPHKCGQCGETDPAKFYGRKRTVCGPCHNVYTLQVGQYKRLRAIAYCGGCCQACGFDKYPCALDFHYRDRAMTDPKYKLMRGWCLERILKEI